MRCKVFTDIVGFGGKLEDRVNEWLTDNHITLVYVTQAIDSGSGRIVLTCFYENERF